MKRIVFLLAGLGLLAALVLGFLGFLHPAFDTLAHFRWHLALGLLLLAILGLFMQIRRAPFILLAFAALGVWLSNANNRIGNIEANASATTSYSLLHFNLRFDNPQREEVLRLIRDSGADILTLSETSRLWEDDLDTLKNDYPYRFHCPEWSTIGGTMTFSRFPIPAQGNYCHEYAAYSRVTAEIGGTPVAIGNVHLRWPWPASGPRQVRELSGELGRIGEDAIVAGDFNATPWSDTVQRFASEGGLTVATGYGGTWIYKLLPATFARTLGLPIDLVQTKGRIRIVSAKTLAPAGSDHLPLLVSFVLEPDTQ